MGWVLCLTLHESEEEQKYYDASRGLRVVAHVGASGFWRTGIDEMPELDH